MATASQKHNVVFMVNDVNGVSFYFHIDSVTIFSWMTRLDAEESAFQCSDDVYDMKICHESVICGLRNGTVEIWNTRTMKKELSLEEQQGSVQVDANEKIGTYLNTIFLHFNLLKLGN